MKSWLMICCPTWHGIGIAHGKHTLLNTEFSCGREQRRLFSEFDFFGTALGLNKIYCIHACRHWISEHTWNSVFRCMVVTQLTTIFWQKPNAKDSSPSCLCSTLRIIQSLVQRKAEKIENGKLSHVTCMFLKWALPMNGLEWKYAFDVWTVDVQGSSVFWWNWRRLKKNVW